MKVKDLCLEARGRLLQEEGSAIVEFIAIAIPLFIPLVLYLSQLNSTIQGSMFLNNLARQMARSYATAPNLDTAIQRTETVLKIARNLGPASSSGNQIHYSVECSSSPCLQPDSRIQITVEKDGRVATATQVVDAW